VDLILPPRCIGLGVFPLRCQNFAHQRDDWRSGRLSRLWEREWLQLTDAPTENYDIVLRDLPSGEHTVAVRVFDQFETNAAGKVTFTVCGAR